jgi:hypothetical protein
MEYSVNRALKYFVPEDDSVVSVEPCSGKYESNAKRLVWWCWYLHME